MKIKFEESTERKKLVGCISEITGEKSSYLGMSTCAYRIGSYTVDKEGALSCDDISNLELLTERLMERGFTPEETSEPDGLAVQLPRTMFSDDELARLRALVSSKESLIKKAVGADILPIEVNEDKISFPWFRNAATPEEANAYMNFISKLASTAIKSKRITGHDHEVENEKYAFRCFLLRLGFIGDEFKTDRKVLLKNLSGSSAFKGGAKHE